MSFFKRFQTKIEFINENNITNQISELAKQYVKEQTLTFSKNKILETIFINKLQYLNDLKYYVKKKEISIAVLKRFNIVIGLCVFRYIKEPLNNISIYNTILLSNKKSNSIEIICIIIDKKFRNEMLFDKFFNMLSEEFNKTNIQYGLWEPRSLSINHSKDNEPDYGSITHTYSCKYLEDNIINLYIEKSKSKNISKLPFEIIKKSELISNHYFIFENFNDWISHLSSSIISTKDLIEYLSNFYNFIRHRQYYNKDIIFGIPKSRSKEFKIFYLYDLYKFDYKKLDTNEFKLLIENLLDIGQSYNNTQYVIFEILPKYEDPNPFYSLLIDTKFNHLVYSNTYLYRFK